jgi:hypothetical protein
MAWTTSDLLTAIKNSQMFPDASSNSLSSDSLLQFATEELYITVLPMIQGIREKYYEKYLDTAYTTATTYLNIPSRSVGQTLSVVQYLVGTDVRPLEPIDPGTIATTQATNEPTNFYFENNTIVFYPPPNSSNGTVRMRYFQRPNRLAQTSACAQITAFNSGTGVATCTPVSTWTTSNIFDFIPQTASKATPYNLDSVISAVSATTMTFTLTAAQAALVTVGDWISLAEYTPVPEIPFELQAILMQATCCRGLASLNDQTALGSAKAILKEYMDAATKLLTPRDMGGNKRVVSNWRRF